MTRRRLVQDPRTLLMWTAHTLTSSTRRACVLAAGWLIWDATRQPTYLGLVAVVEALPTALATLAAPRDPTIPRVRARPLLRAHPLTAAAMALHAGGQFASAVTLLLPMLIGLRAGNSPAAYAAAVTAAGLGALAGNLAASASGWATRFPGVHCAAWALQGLIVTALGFAVTPWQILTLCAAGGTTTAFVSISLRAHLDTHPAPERARLRSLDQGALLAAGVLGALLIPAVASTDCPGAAYVLAGLAILVLAGAMWMTGSTVADRAALRSARLTA